MNQTHPGEGEVLQALRLGAHTRQRVSPGSTMFVTAGRRIYALGDIDGRFRPRSNPYDLHAFGKPQPGDPLAWKLQGVWAQPVKGFSRYGFVIESGDTRWPLDDAERFTQSFDSAQFDYRRGPLEASRRDIPALDLPVLFSTLTVRNTGAAALDLRVTFAVQFDLEDIWFTQMAEQRNDGETVTVEGERLVARSLVLPERWAAAAGALQAVETARLTGDSAGELVSFVRLAPGGEETLVFGMAVEVEGGAYGAVAALERCLPRHAAFQAERQALYADLLARGPRLVSPDAALNMAFDLARANLQQLEAETPSMGRFFYAGLEIFPYWFSNDGAYSVPGLLASGLRDSALNHIRIGLRYLGEGRVPHQIAPSGKLAFAGNAQETPLWVMSIWDAYRWTGDREFLAELFSGAWKGMFAYVLSAIDPDGDGYPSGPGMVEVEGMGAEKLDSAAYTWSALLALAEMANVLGKASEAEQARERAGQIRARFDEDWWDAAGGTYAMSLMDPDNARFPLPHWAVIVPLEVGLAAPEHAARTFTTLRASYLNRWGLKHTVGDDERVWTLPTATLSRAAYRCSEAELGFAMLRHITETLDHGSIGLFHELIPEGACIIQLWSAATFLRGVIEDLLGIDVRAGEHTLVVSPQLPAGWETARLENLSFGEHRISLEVTPSTVTVAHHVGPAPLTVRWKNRAVQAAPGEKASIVY